MSVSARATIIVVSGLPCSGKSTLALHLRARLQWPLLAKDRFKEVLFNSLGVRDRKWSRDLSAAAYALLFAEARELASLHADCIVEGNFRHSEQVTRFAELAKLPIQFLQAHCHAAPAVLIERFSKRVSERHPGHADVESFEEIRRELLSTEQRPLPISGEIVDCPSDDLDSDWCGEATERVLRALGR